MSEFPHFTAPLDLGFTQLRNRLVMGSMHTNLEELGDWDRVAEFYAARARGGAGLMVTGGMSPNAEGGVFQGAAGLFTDQDIKNHQHVTERVHDAGGQIAMQILHAGRYAYSPHCVAPSAIKSPISPFTPKEMTEEEILKQIRDIATAGARARDAGYDGIELMGSEGYLINQFLVTHTNKRTDAWGGSYENRMRFAIEALRAVRAAVGDDFIIIFRLSMIDLIPEGSSFDEVLTLAKAVEAEGATILNTGIGWHEARIPTIATSVPRAAFAWVTQQVKEHVSLPVMTSNRINTPEVAEEVLASGAADLISMARPMLADPEFMRKTLDGRAKLITPCIACNQACLDHTFSGKTSSCLVNPRAAFETKIPMIQAATSRSIAVVGAGPAGLYAAFTAKQRGHDVTLYDASARIGGQLNIAAQIPGKEEFKGFLDWLEATRTQLGIDTRLGTRATAEDLAHHDAVIVATGVTPRRPDIDGIDHPKVVSYLDVLRRNVEVGRKVAVIGAGGIGFDTAQFLVHPVDHSTDLDHWLEFWGIANPKDHRGGIDPAGPMPSSPAREVTLLQRSGRKVGAGLGKTTGWIHRKELQMMGVRMMGGVNYHRIDDEGLHISLGEEVRDAQVLCVDHVVICAGQLSYDPLSDALSQMGIETHVIGGAFEAGELDAKRAIDQAVRLAVTL